MGSELEEQLMEAGKVLLQPPSDSTHLLKHLDKVVQLLGNVDQSPTRAMLAALSPIIKAVVQEELLKNNNEDVQVAVASCISEITRITAPDAPYEDNLMKEVFQLIVSSFKNLSDDSSQSYSKRILILETVAKVRSCVVMLDLECDGLIVEMFQHFLKAIRDHHPDNVFSSMEIIMTLVLEESEDIRFELISPILACLKKNNEQIQAIARKLAENVIQKSAAKVKPCLLEAKSSMNICLDDYSSIISDVCEEINHAGQDIHKSPGQDNHKTPGEKMTKYGVANGVSSGEAVQGDENKVDIPSSDEAPQDQVTKESDSPFASVVTGPEEDHPVPMETDASDTNPSPIETEEHPVVAESGRGDDHPDPLSSSKSVTSNGVAETENQNALKNAEDTKDPLNDDANVSRKAEPAVSDSGKLSKVVSKVSKKRSKRTRTEACIDTGKETKDKNDEDKVQDDEVHVSPSRDPSTEVAVDKEDERETEEVSSPETIESGEQESEKALNENRSRKAGRSKKKNKSKKKTLHSKDVPAKELPEGASDSEVKLKENSRKKAIASDSPAEKAQVPVKKSKVEVGSESDSEIKLVKRSSRKADITPKTVAEGSSSKKKVEDKKLAHGKITPDNAGKVSALKPMKEVRDDTPLKEALKTSSKRKRTPTQEKATDTKKYGKDLVGTRIKVWWPMDEMFYEGVVDSFDSKSKKHTVSYADGDQELLNLREEKWELVEDDESMKDGDQETKAGNPDTSPEIQKKKAKTSSGTPAKKGKTDSPRDLEASSSKSKGSARKPNPKEDIKLAKFTPKFKVRSKKRGGNSSVESDSPKPNIKFKLGSPKTATKSTPKTATKEDLKTAVKETLKSGSKGDNSKARSKLISPGGSGKVKSGSSKSKEIKEKEKSPEVSKAGKGGKGKTPEATPKGKESEGKSGRKRRRS